MYVCIIRRCHKTSKKLLHKKSTRVAILQYDNEITPSTWYNNVKEGKLTSLKKQETWYCYKSNTSTIDNKHTYLKEIPGNRGFFSMNIQHYFSSLMGTCRAFIFKVHYHEYHLTVMFYPQIFFLILCIRFKINISSYTSTSNLFSANRFLTYCEKKLKG